MNRRFLLGACAVFLTGVCAFGQRSSDDAIEDAWAAWKSGDIRLAEERGRACLDENNIPDEARHLLFLTSFVAGDYQEALDLYGAIDSNYARLNSLNKPYIEACRHLKRFDDALAFAKERGLPSATISSHERRATAPLKAMLDGVSIVPFADHPMTQYFPAFEAELNGHAVTAHVDTGGPFLVMGVERAKALGIELFPSGKGFHGRKLVDLHEGIAESFRLGDALLENVPVTTLASFTGDDDWVIFGTNVLEQFYSTLDYPNQRLIISPRGDESQTAQHRAMLPGNVSRLPFYLWGDHYMFSRGTFGEHTGLTFFVDSGLVSLHPGPNGGTVQAAFKTSREKLREWGVPDDVLDRPFFQLDVPLGLGTLTRDGLYVLPQRSPSSYGGVQIDGMLSHAFLNAYAWTIDFDSREYIFSSEQ